MDRKSKPALRNSTADDGQEALMRHQKTEKPTKKVSFEDPTVSKTTRPATKLRDPLHKNVNRAQTGLVQNTNKPMMKSSVSLPSTEKVDVDRQLQDIDKDHQNIYARPELNTVLLLAERIQALEMEDFDSTAAVESRLADCLLTRQRLEEASLRPLNFKPDDQIYDGVMHLSFDEEAVLCAAAEEKEAKARLVLPTQRTRDPEPRLDDYRVEDAVQREFVRFPTFTLDDLDLGQPVNVPRSSAYNLYRHQRMWNGLSS